MWAWTGLTGSSPHSFGKDKARRVKPHSKTTSLPAAFRPADGQVPKQQTSPTRSNSLKKNSFVMAGRHRSEARQGRRGYVYGPALSTLVNHCSWLALPPRQQRFRLQPFISAQFLPISNQECVWCPAAMRGELPMVSTAGARAGKVFRSDDRTLQREPRHQNHAARVDA